MDSKKAERVFHPTPPGAQADTTATRQRSASILHAATLAFARSGYERASMRSIARDAGVSLAGLYHHVDGKERLLFLVQFRAFSALLTEVKSRLCGEDEPVRQLRILIHTHVEYVADNMAALKVCSHELDSLTGDAYEQVRRVRRDYYELARSIIGRIIDESGADPSLDRRTATMCLFGSLNWLYRWYDPQGERSPASLANQVFTQCLGGILGVAKANAAFASDNGNDSTNGRLSARTG